MDAPTESIVRAAVATGRLELRAAAADAGADAMPTLHGHFLRFNEWTEISSYWEGNFMERVAPGSINKTIAERRDAIKCLYDHGYDPFIGNKVLGPFDDLREDGVIGGYYEVPLLDTTYNRDLLPGLGWRKDGTRGPSLYGASFRFRVIKEQWDDEPGVSAYNPKGLPERTILEIALYELGPVTFPAYESATAGLRSMTDAWIERMIQDNPAAAARFAERAADLRTPTPAGADAARGGTPAGPGAASNSGDEPAAGHSTDTAGMSPAERLRALQIQGVIR